MVRIRTRILLRLTWIRIYLDLVSYFKCHMRSTYFEKFLKIKNAFNLFAYYKNRNIFKKKKYLNTSKTNTCCCFIKIIIFATFLY